MKQRRFLIHVDAVQTYQRKSAEKVQHMTSERRLAFAAAVSVLRGTVGLYAVRLMGHFGRGEQTQLGTTWLQRSRKELKAAIC